MGGQSVTKSRHDLRAAIFDFDDTLLATRRARTHVLIVTAKDFGIRLSARTIESHWGKPFQDLISGIVPTVPYATFYRKYASRMAEYPPEVGDGVRSTLSRLARRRVPILVLSSGSYRLVRQDLVAARLWRFVTRLWGFEQTKRHKPDPMVLAPILTYLQRRHWKATEVIYVGDSLGDYAVARASGIPFYAVTSGVHSKRDFVAAGLDSRCVLASMKYLPSALEL